MAGLPTRYREPIDRTNIIDGDELVAFEETMRAVEKLRRTIERDKRYVRRFWSEVDNGVWYVCAEAV